MDSFPFSESSSWALSKVLRADSSSFRVSERASAAASICSISFDASSTLSPNKIASPPAPEKYCARSLSVYSPLSKSALSTGNLSIRVWISLSVTSPSSRIWVSISLNSVCVAESIAEVKDSIWERSDMAGAIAANKESAISCQYLPHSSGCRYSLAFRCRS